MICTEQKMHFIVIKCINLWYAMNWTTFLTRKIKFRKVFVFAYMKQLTTLIWNKNSYHEVVKHLMFSVEWSKIKCLFIENQIFKSSIFCEIFLKSWFTYQYENYYYFYDPKDVASYIISKCVYKTNLIKISFSNNFNSYWKSF